MMKPRTILMIAMASLLVSIPAHAELLRVQIRTLGMD